MKKYLLLSLLLAALVMAFKSGTKYTLTGKVTDKQGNPVQGASVVLKGTSRGTVTDVNGDFKLE
jgi:hypothetical protein